MVLVEDEVVVVDWVEGEFVDDELMVFVEDVLLVEELLGAVNDVDPPPVAPEEEVSALVIAASVEQTGPSTSLPPTHPLYSFGEPSIFFK